MITIITQILKIKKLIYLKYQQENYHQKKTLQKKYLQGKIIKKLKEKILKIL